MLVLLATLTTTSGVRESDSEERTPGGCPGRARARAGGRRLDVARRRARAPRLLSWRRSVRRRAASGPRRWHVERRAPACACGGHGHLRRLPPRWWSSAHDPDRGWVCRHDAATRGGLGRAGRRGLRGHRRRRRRRERRPHHAGAARPPRRPAIRRARGVRRPVAASSNARRGSSRACCRRARGGTGPRGGACTGCPGSVPRIGAGGAACSGIRFVSRAGRRCCRPPARPGGGRVPSSGLANLWLAEARASARGGSTCPCARAADSERDRVAAEAEADAGRNTGAGRKPAACRPCRIPRRRSVAAARGRSAAGRVRRGAPESGCSDQGCRRGVARRPSGGPRDGRDRSARCCPRACSRAAR